MSEVAREQKPDVLVLIEKAWEEVAGLCSGKRRWTMRVPAEEDRDSDLVIGGALDAAKDEIVRLREGIRILQDNFPKTIPAPIDRPSEVSDDTH